MKRNKRKGFAIILVASLAGLVFLLGASLVVVTHLQTAAANYDQRVRLAREHARASLDMAIAELQDKLGNDTAVSYYADVLRENKNEDFKDAAATGVREPFWAAARNGGTTSWLVTRELDGSVKSPIGEFTGDSIKLLGSGTLGSNPLLEVSVPKESIQVDEVDGFTDARTIGHYAYWVGDLGTKASYALYDEDGQVDGYNADKQERLSQLRPSKPGLESVDTNDTSVTPTNPARVDLFASDFQFRDRFGDADETERYLLGLTETEVQSSFHDFTPLTKGLLVNSASGGFREDLSNLVATADPSYNSQFLPFVKLAKSESSKVAQYDDHRFPVQVVNAPVVPVITQFNLNYSVYLSDDQAGVQQLFISFAAAVELWNPYSSAIDLGGQSLVLEMVNLPDLAIWFNSGAVGSTPAWQGNLGTLGETPVFEIKSLGSSTNRLRPGQIAVFSGPDSTDISEGQPFSLKFGPDQLSQTDDRVVVEVGPLTLSDTVTTLVLRFMNGVQLATSDFKVNLYLKNEDTTQTLLSTYDLLYPFSLPAGADTNVTQVGVPSLGFAWEIADSVLPDFSAYHPLKSTLPQSSLLNFNDIANQPVNRELTFLVADKVSSLLGYNPTDIVGPIDTHYDISVLQLPKQELSSVAQLSNAYGTSWISPKLGEPNSPDNALLDKFFFSTVPSLWASGDVLPNTAYEPKAGSVPADLTAKTSADCLFANGMFNVHSTSIDAWTALLKSSPASANSHWIEYFEKIEEPDEVARDGVLDAEKYLFYNFPLGAEDRYEFGIAPDNASDEVRASLSQSMFAFSDAQVELLAKHIVANIRKRLQGVTPYAAGSNKGPFVSLRDFADSGVIKNAIADAQADAEMVGRFTPTWVVPGTPAEFRQSTVLNLIGAYISVRSDTFLVRAYGDAVDPANPGKIWARAYCEAILQRTHEQYGDVVSESASDKGDLDRKFEVVAFRWLSPSEI